MDGIGISDLPVGSERDDQLGISGYAAGLADFILRCPMPMTIAVQGDWGTGKTSTMSLVQGHLRDATVVSFNTWQYSQFDLGEDLPFHLLQTIMTRLTDDGTGRKNAFLRRAWLATTKAGRAAASTFSHIVADRIGGDIASTTVDAFVGKLLETGDDRGPAGLFEELREEFAEIVAVNNSAKGPAHRTVIFVDDLDRIRPTRAVEIMEILKTVMDVDGCVYVLAIDFNVVRQGVRDKYGPEFDERKAAAFFDKIIQVPFHMPVSSFEIEPLLRAHSADLGEDSATAVDLLRSSIGRNPRSVKRILNAVALNTCIQDHVRGGSAPRLRPVEFLGSAALQTAYAGFYAELDERDADGKGALLEGVLRLADDSGDPEDQEPWVTHGVEKDRFGAFLEFITRYADALDLRDGQSVDGQRVEEVMQITSVTMGHQTREREPAIARVLDLASRVSNQRARISDPTVLDRIAALENAVRADVGEFVATESNCSSRWRWYAVRPGGTDKPRRRFCEVSLPRSGRPTFYVGRASWPNADELRGLAEGLGSAGWDVVVSERSDALVHVRAVSPDADLMQLHPLLVAAYRGAGASRDHHVGAGSPRRP
ncbi:KAP family P-loop NTPase fold protein [Ornithinicoccus hortensis]|uniref:KAP-like P-loop domain-containing protein n=1 Tax=Ornithinicoccus hortensis TaxID=82346 RepID=A0A542YWR6_9MICO|nr:P-loop NTPase fold protein [Ornithinicoccus hortensis]TQL52414.1 KAP-like P-loop domain-containing protein [Ornithinicoccus hortensis]